MLFIVSNFISNIATHNIRHDSYNYCCSIVKPHTRTVDMISFQIFSIFKKISKSNSNNLSCFILYFQLCLTFYFLRY